MNLRKKILQGAFALGIGISSFTGCAATQTYAPIEDAMGILDIKNPNMIEYLNNGYKISKFKLPYLITIAGIYSGSIKVEKTEDGYLAKGTYSQLKNPEGMQKALREVDSNGDKIITPQELINLEKKVYKEYCE